jgi:hypothetical protein
MNKNDLDTMAADLAEKLGIETEMGKAFLRLQLDAALLMESKQKDYGSGNISAFGEFGVLVRCSDKVNRLKTLLEARRAPKHEALEDSWKDLASYGTIGLMCHRGLWK